MTSWFDDAKWPKASEWLVSASGNSHKAGLVVLGVPLARQSITPSRCDLAPDAIRSALSNFTVFDIAHEHDLQHVPVRDAGNLPIADATPDECFNVIKDEVCSELASAHALLLLGGNNSITYPACCGMGVPLERCGLITLDAHLDLRHMEYGLVNGNPIRALLEQGLPGNNIYQIGIQSFANSAGYARDAIQAGIHVIPIDVIREDGLAAVVCNCLRELSAKAEGIYVDLDIDVLDRAFAPAAAGSRPGGLMPRELRASAYEFGRHPLVRILDIVEVDPTRDINDITVLTAGACLLSFASGLLARNTEG